jgi:hypothetical protein
MTPEERAAAFEQGRFALQETEDINRAAQQQYKTGRRTVAARTVDARNKRMRDDLLSKAAARGIDPTTLSGANIIGDPSYTAAEQKHALEVLRGDVQTGGRWQAAELEQVRGQRGRITASTREGRVNELEALFARTQQRAGRLGVDLSTLDLGGGTGVKDIQAILQSIRQAPSGPLAGGQLSQVRKMLTTATGVVDRSARLAGTDVDLDALSDRLGKAKMKAKSANVQQKIAALEAAAEDALKEARAIPRELRDTTEFKNAAKQASGAIREYDAAAKAPRSPRALAGLFSAANVHLMTHALGGGLSSLASGDFVGGFSNAGTTIGRYMQNVALTRKAAGLPFKGMMRGGTAIAIAGQVASAMIGKGYEVAEAADKLYEFAEPAALAGMQERAFASGQAGSFGIYPSSAASVLYDAALGRAGYKNYEVTNAPNMAAGGRRDTYTRYERDMSGVDEAARKLGMSNVRAYLALQAWGTASEGKRVGDSTPITIRDKTLTRPEEILRGSARGAGPATLAALRRAGIAKIDANLGAMRVGHSGAERGATELLEALRPMQSFTDLPGAMQMYSQFRDAHGKGSMRPGDEVAYMVEAMRLRIPMSVVADQLHQRGLRGAKPTYMYDFESLTNQGIIGTPREEYIKAITSQREHAMHAGLGFDSIAQSRATRAGLLAGGSQYDMMRMHGTAEAMRAGTVGQLSAAGGSALQGLLLAEQFEGRNYYEGRTYGATADPTERMLKILKRYQGTPLGFELNASLQASDPAMYERLQAQLDGLSPGAEATGEAMLPMDAFKRTHAANIQSYETLIGGQRDVDTVAQIQTFKAATANASRAMASLTDAVGGFLTKIAGSATKPQSVPSPSSSVPGSKL